MLEVMRHTRWNISESYCDTQRKMGIWEYINGNIQTIWRLVTGSELRFLVPGCNLYSVYICVYTHYISYVLMYEVITFIASALCFFFSLGHCFVLSARLQCAISIMATVYSIICTVSRPFVQFNLTHNKLLTTRGDYFPNVPFH